MKVNALSFDSYLHFDENSNSGFDRHETLDMAFISVSNYPVLADWLVMLWE